MKIAVVSGKGGVGKTSVAVSLVLARGSGTIVDCDVEEPNVALLLNPVIEGREVAKKPVPKVMEDLCDRCKVCAEACQFNAIMVLPNTVIIFEKMCHSCGVCSYVCPKGAIKEEERDIGEIEWGRCGNILYWGGRLNIGEAMATPLISAVKKRAAGDPVVVDSPPGITCPMVEAVEGSDFVVVVAESSAFGLHDFRLLREYISGMDVPFGVLENKLGMSPYPVIEEFCRKEGLLYLGAIPYRSDFASAYAEGIPLINADATLRDLFEDIWRRIEVEAS